MPSLFNSSLPRTCRCASSARQMPPGSASPSSHVDRIPEDVAAVDHDVADIDADAELDPLLVRHVGIALRHAALDVHGTTHRVHDTAELGQHAVAGVLDDPPTVLGNLG